MQVEDKNLPPGRYTFPVAAKLKEKRARNLILVREAEQDLESIKALLTKHTKTLTTAKEEHKQSTEAFSKSKEHLAAKIAPRNQLMKAIRAEQASAAALADKLALAVKDVTNADLLGEIVAAQQALQESQAQRSAAQAAFAEVQGQRFSGRR